jgi:type I restriction enzyme, S subunit
MELKPGYKQTEAGVAPDDWQVRSLLTAVRIASGQVDPRIEPFRSMILVAPDHIESGSGRLLQKKTANDQHAISGKYRFAAGDIVYSKIRPYLRKAILADFEGLCSADMYPLRPASDVSAGFIFTAILGHHFSKYAESVSVRSGMPKINRAELAEYMIALPPTKSEQEAIAKVLSDADTLIESLEQLIGKKRHLKQGAMQELLTGRKRLPGFSGEWKVRPLGDLFRFSRGFTASREQLSMEGYCYLHYGDIHMSTKSFIDMQSEHQAIPKLNIALKTVSPASLLEDGDVVFVDASEDDEGTSRHVVIMNKEGTPFISGLHTIVAKGKTNELDHQYRRYCFQTAEIKQQFRFFAVGTKVSGISKTNITRITIPVPEGPEQTAIAAILSDMDAEIAALGSKLAKARYIKQGMMQELLTGTTRLV